MLPKNHFVFDSNLKINIFGFTGPKVSEACVIAELPEKNVDLMAEQ